MTETTSKNNKKTLKIALGVGALVLLVAVFVLVYTKFSAKPVAGEKAITIEVVDNNAASTVYELNTDAEFLRQAIEEAQAQGLTVTGTESEYGLMVDTVNGIRADYTLDGAYWSFNLNGTYCNYGIDTQPVNDGDTFSIVYTPAE